MKSKNLTLIQFSKKSGLTVKQVRDRIRKGLIPSQKIGNKLYVPADSVKKDGVMPDFLDGRRTEGARLKEELTTMQIKKIHQQLKEGQDEVRRKFKGEVIQCVAKTLTAIKCFLLKMNLNEQQITEMDECFSVVSKRLSQVDNSTEV